MYVSMYVEKFKTLEWNGYAAQIKIRNTCSLSGQLDEYEGVSKVWENIRKVNFCEGKWKELA